GLLLLIAQVAVDPHADRDRTNRSRRHLAPRVNLVHLVTDDRFHAAIIGFSGREDAQVPRHVAFDTRHASSGRLAEAGEALLENLLAADDPAPPVRGFKGFDDLFDALEIELHRRHGLDASCAEETFEDR